MNSANDLFILLCNFPVDPLKSFSFESQLRNLLFRLNFILQEVNHLFIDAFNLSRLLFIVTPWGNELLYF